MSSEAVSGGKMAAASSGSSRTARSSKRHTLSVLLNAMYGIEVVVELKNDEEIKGTIDGVDNAMNLVLKPAATAITAVTGAELQEEPDDITIPGNSIRYVHLPKQLNARDIMNKQEKKTKRNTPNTQIIDRKDNKRFKGEDGGKKPEDVLL